MRRPRINYALAATLLASGMHPDEIAPKVGAKNGNVLSVGLCKKGVNQRNALAPILAKSISKSFTLNVANEAGNILAERANHLKERLSTELSNQVAILEKNPASSVKELQQGRTQTVKQLIESANALSPGSTGLTPVTMLFLEQDQPIEVETSVSQDTTGSVPVQEPILPDTLGDKPQ